MIALLLGVLAAIGLTMVLGPSVSRPTVPLGVSVPSERANDDVVRQAIANYRRGCVGATVLCMGAGVLLPSQWAFLVLPLALIVAACVIFAVARRAIIETKRRQHWYQGHKVGIGADITARPDNPPALHGLFVAALGLAVLGVVVLLGRYASLPDPYPQHWGLRGGPDIWTPKSLWAVLWTGAWAVPIVLLIWGSAYLVARSSQPRYPDGDPARARQAQHEQFRLAQHALALLALTLATHGLAANLVVVSNHLDAMPVLTWVMLAVVQVVIIGWLVLAARAFAAAKKAVSAGPGSGTQSPDDDDYWKWGMFYYNPHNPAFLVPKRMGVGLTFNNAHWGAKLCWVIVALLLAFAIFAVVTGGK